MSGQPSMTVLGDLQQGIHGYAGISSWSQQRDLFPAEETGDYELDRSYRSTTEIIDFANRVLAGHVRRRQAGYAGIPHYYKLTRWGMPIRAVGVWDTVGQI